MYKSITIDGQEIIRVVSNGEILWEQVSPAVVIFHANTTINKRGRTILFNFSASAWRNGREETVNSGQKILFDDTVYTIQVIDAQSDAITVMLNEDSSQIISGNSYTIKILA